MVYKYNIWWYHGIQDRIAGYGVFAIEDIVPAQPCSVYNGLVFDTEIGVETMESGLEEIGEGHTAVYTMQVEGVNRNKKRKFWLDGREEKTFLGLVVDICF
jgi:hypothetical protein